MGSSAPIPPPPPDPVKTASSQGAANVQTANAQTALNNANVITPYGSSIYDITGRQKIVQPDGSIGYANTYTNTQTLAPAQQHLLNQNNRLSSQENNLAGQALTSAGDTLANPLTSDSFAPIQTSAGAAPTLQSSYNQGPAVQTSFNQGPALQYGYDAGGNIQKDVNLNSNAPTSFGQTNTQLLSSLGNTDFTADRDAATNAALARLQPTMDQQASALQAQLANQGVAQGSAAYNAGLFQQNQANNDLRLGAVATGDAEQQALFGQKLSSGQFQNAAQQQEYGQLLGRGQFAQAGIDQNNTALLNAGAFHNSAQGQQNAQNNTAAGFYNQTVGQQYGQNAGAAAFANQAAGQINAQNQAGAGFFNQAQNQGYQNQLAGAQFGNEAQQQQYTQGIGLNNNTVNLIDAFRSGGQVSAPQFAGYTAGTLDQTPLASSVYNSAGLAQSAYNTQAGLDAANTTAMGSILGAGLGMFKFSDRRLKRDIERVATARNGLPIYLYRYRDAPEWHLGFMADEVAQIRPDAVRRHGSGFAMVDYARAAA